MSKATPPRKNAFIAAVGLIGTAGLAGVIAAAMAMPAVGTAGVTARNAARGFNDLPSNLTIPPLPQRSRILASDGSTIATFYYENRRSVPLKQVAPVMRKAIVAIEDSRFYSHGGLDLKGTLRALVNDTSGDEGRQGGSTLTQQYVKNVLVEQAGQQVWAATRQVKTAKAELAAMSKGSDKKHKTAATNKLNAAKKRLHNAQDAENKAHAPTVARKLRELRYAINVEKKYSKNTILERYLNIAYFGDGAYGIEAAAEHYFGVHANKLDLKQAATLAGIVRNPYKFAPTLNPKSATQRRNTVLMRMAQLHEVSQKKANKLSHQKLALHPHKEANGCKASNAPFFCDYVLDEIQSDPVFKGKGVQLLLNGGLTVKTTLNVRMQHAAQHAVDRYVPPDNHYNPQKAAAEAIVHPGFGTIKAMAVDRMFGPDSKKGTTSVNFASDADHGGSHGFQAGSTFKLFTLVAALKQGMGFGTGFHSPQHMTLSGYKDCAGNPTAKWPVHNAGDSEAGNFDMRQGTAKSVNTYFAQLEKKAGLCKVVKAAKELGIHRADGGDLQQVPTFTLGVNEVSPLDVANAYATVAARGIYCKPIAIASITDHNGKHIKVPSAKCHRAISKSVADAATYLLRGTLRAGGTGAADSIGRPAAAKTGTADDEVSSFFAGFTPQLAAAVWMGTPVDPFHHPMDHGLCLGGTCYGTPIYGATIAGKIWQSSMEHSLAGLPAENFTRPPGRFFTKSPFHHGHGHKHGHGHGHGHGGKHCHKVGPFCIPNHSGHH